MRRFLPFLLVCTLMAVPAFAQRGGARGGGGGFGGGMRGGGFGGGMRGGGFGGMRGGGFGGGAYGGFRGGGFGGFGGGAYGGFRGGGFNGFRGGRFRGGFNRFRFGFSNFGFYPFIYPAFYGGFYDPFWYGSWDSSYNPYSYPSYPYPYNYPSGGYGTGGPSVVIISNSPYGNPAATPSEPDIVAAPSTAVQAPARATEPAKYEEPLFLLAFHDGTIRAVLAYWLDGTTVHYVTMEHEQKETPLSSIDRDLSERLNQERNVTFRLPR